MSTFGAFTVTRASTKNVLGSNGLYQSVANNVPAFEFNTDGSYRGLLVEPGATNLMLNSQDLTAVSWSTQGSAVTGDTTIAPDGTTTGDTLTGDGTNTTVYVNQNMTFSTAGTYTLSFFAKAGTHDIIRVNITNYVGSTSTVTGYDLTNGTTTVASNPITAVGNGWYLIQFTFTIDAGDLSGNIRIFLSPSTGTTAWSSAGDSNGESVILWQGQVESGSVATSYIVTTGSTASRSADNISLSSASSLIGQTQGAIYIEAELRAITGSGTRLVGVSDGTSNNVFRITKNNSNQVEFVVVTAGVTQAQIASSGTLVESVVKFAGAYALDDIAFYANGTSIGTDASATIPATSVVNLGQNESSAFQINGWIRAFALYTTRLSNAQLASLTT